MAKQDKVDAQIQNKGKKTTLGESVNLIEQKEQEEQQAIKNMHESIKYSIDTAINLNSKYFVIKYI